jgi:hypothetical protein
VTQQLNELAKLALIASGKKKVGKKKVSGTIVCRDEVN